MKATAIQIGKTYEIAFGKNTTKVKVKKFDPKNGSWICETESGKSIPIKDPKRFLKECQSVDKRKEPKKPKQKVVPNDEGEHRDMNFPSEIPTSSEDTSAKEQFDNEYKTHPVKQFPAKEAAQLVAAANDASIRAAIAKKAAGYGFCSDEIAEAAAEDATAARDIVKAAGIIEQKSGRSNGLMSGIDAAHRVLIEQGRPMRAKEILKIATDNQYCELHGFTPDATISAAMETEIKRKGDTARFVKVGKGLFIAR
jgi:hypothetical protein